MTIDIMREKGTSRYRRESSANERLRRRYRPAEVRLLFIGESPPSSGRFFYRQDSGLYRAVRDAFRAVDPSIADHEFLERFQKAGCYLIDTCVEPVDHLDARSRRAACWVGEASLARRIRRLRPCAIVVLVKSIRDNVRRAIATAGWSGPLIEVPYPGRWAHHREIFLQRLAPRLAFLCPASTTFPGQRQLYFPTSDN